MIDIEFVIEMGIIPPEEEIKKEFGAFDYEIYETALTRMDEMNPLEQALTYNALGQLFEGNFIYRNAAACYAFATTYNVPSAFRLLLQVLKINTPDSRYYDPELASIPIKNIEAKYNALLQMIDQEEKSESKSPEVQVNVPKNEFVIIDPTLKSLMEKTKTPMILAERLDLMYEILQLTEQLAKKIYTNKAVKDSLVEIRNQAKRFIEMVLDTNSDEKIATLMQERTKKRALDPELIPGIKPLLSPLINKLEVDSDDSQAVVRWRKLTELAVAKKLKKAMPLTKHGIEADTLVKTKYLTSVERDIYRILIKDGKFYRRVDSTHFELFGTPSFYSHNKFAFGAYVMNVSGELSVFTHMHMGEKMTPYAHSTMSRGKAVFAAGEMKIIKGKLTTLTVHSGHYEPGAENVYHFLDYLKSRNVDFSEMTIYFFQPLDKHPFLYYEYHNTMPAMPYAYNAESFYLYFKEIYRLNEEKAKNVTNPFDEKKEEASSKWLTGHPVLSLVRYKKTECLERLDEIKAKYPEFKNALDPIKTGIDLIDPAMKSSAKELNQQRALLLTAIKEMVYQYIYSLSNIAAKYHNPEIKQSFQKLLALEQKFMLVDTNYKKYADFMEIMGSTYSEAKTENKKINITLKSTLEKSVVELKADIRSCMKSGITHWWRSSKSQFLTDILNRLDALQKAIQLVKTDSGNPIGTLDNDYHILAEIVSELKKPSNLETIKEAVSETKFETLLAKWSDKLEPLEAKQEAKSELADAHQIATSAPSDMPKTR